MADHDRRIDPEIAQQVVDGEGGILQRPGGSVASTVAR
jgi:hypothetical protein